MIDEWQEVPSIWDATRSEVDRRHKKGQIILTGSSTPKTKGIMHSGAGRIVRLRMNTMSLFESGDSLGQISLEKLCNGDLTMQLLEDVSLEKIAEYIVRGGWPENITVDEKKAHLMPRAYMDSVIEKNLNNLDDGIEYNKHKVQLLLRSLARNESTTISDSSLLNITADKLLGDLNTFGFLFEALVERDLAIYTQSFRAKLFHYQDYKKNEIDAVIEIEDGEWCVFEIKLGAKKIDEGAKNIIKVCSDIVYNGGKAPKIMCVICGLSNAAYQRPDGVFVVPITALKN